MDDIFRTLDGEVAVTLTEEDAAGRFDEIDTRELVPYREMLVIWAGADDDGNRGYGWYIRGECPDYPVDWQLDEGDKSYAWFADVIAGALAWVEAHDNAPTWFRGIRTLRQLQADPGLVPPMPKEYDGEETQVHGWWYVPVYQEPGEEE